MKKNQFKIISLVVLIIFLVTNFTNKSFAQSKKTSLAVLNIDSQGFDLTPKQMGNLVRIEVEKLDTFEVIDRYDVAYLIQKHDLMIDNCFGKICLVESGKIIKAEKMLSGSVEMYGQTTIITLRLIDVETATIEKTKVKEFLDLPNELQQMIRITMREMFELPIDEDMLTRLTKKYNYENAINNPNKVRLALAGPRVGGSYIFGQTAKYLALKEHQGGYDIFPAMSQFGYQIELQYLTHGNIQALVEFIPSISGVEQGLFFPSISFLQGIRHTKNGIEIAFGPTFSVTRIAKGYYVNNEWHLREEWTAETPNPYYIEKRLDSRGDFVLSPGLILGVGKTFKSGNLNLPVNTFVALRKNSVQLGLSVGFNVKKN